MNFKKKAQSVILNEIRKAGGQREFDRETTTLRALELMREMVEDGRLEVVTEDARQVTFKIKF